MLKECGLEVLLDGKNNSLKSSVENKLNSSRECLYKIGNSIKDFSTGYFKGFAPFNVSSTFLRTYPKLNPENNSEVLGHMMVMDTEVLVGSLAFLNIYHGILTPASSIEPFALYIGVKVATNGFSYMYEKGRRNLNEITKCKINRLMS